MIFNEKITWKHHSETKYICKYDGSVGNRNQHANVDIKIELGNIEITLETSQLI